MMFWFVWDARKLAPFWILPTHILVANYDSEKNNGEARNPDLFLFTVCSVWKNMQYHEILIEKTNPDILHQIAKSGNPDWILFPL